MKTILLVLSVLGITSVNAGFLNGGHFIPTTNIVSSRTILGSAVGGGPTSGAISTAQYSQTVPAPATVQTIITSHPGPNIGYTGTGIGGAGGGGQNNGGQNIGGQNIGGNIAGAYGNYVYSTGPRGNTQASSSALSSSVSTQGINTGSGLNSGYGQSQPSYYNQRHY